jgi:multidrug efflux system membrane fusion protein
MHATLLFVVAAFAQLAAPPTSSSNTVPGADPSYPAIIHAENDIRIFAEAEGLLTKLLVREGSHVKRGDLIATIDDRTALAAFDVAKSSFRAADERAKDKIEEQYAEAAAGVAKLDYEMSVQANTDNPNTISLIDMEKKKLDWRRATLQIEKAQKDQVLARFEADVKDAERRAAEVALDRRKIFAPFDGEIEDMILHESEWVNPGDPIMRLIQFDVMWVETWVNSQDHDPSELQNRPVTVRISLAHGREAKVQGRVIHVSQSTTDATRGYAKYRVRAEIQNQRSGDFWLVRPGLPAWMDIHVNQPAVTAAATAPPAR